jgi:hypothetical protein
MEARVIWDTWRRILTSDALVHAVLEPPEDLASLGLTPDETAILADYASTRAATEQTIFMYRNGLVRNALCSLHLVPLSNRLLDASGLDPAEVARAFAASNGYRDEGPNLWRLAAAFVAYLAKLPELASSAAQDVLAIDAAALALVRRLAERPPVAWPDDGGPIGQPAREGPLRYVASRAATVASTSCDLTPWLEDPFAFDVDAALDHVESHWLIYLRNANAAPAYAELSARAARAFTYVATPKTASQLAAELDLAVTEAVELIDSLVGLGGVTIETPADDDSHKGSMVT